MAIVRAQDALSFAPRSNYHVFLSFRGEDTRKTFTDHLYAALSGAGLRTFIDDEGIERGENVNSELEKAIKAARSSIIVFSKDYASSRWCLDELVMILEHKRTSGHVILPVFFDVVPSQVRHQTESFAKAFGRHEELFMIETDETKREDLRNKVEGWREALREVANLAGMDLQNVANGHESKFIHKIVQVIGAQLNRKVLHVAPYVIGMEYRVRDINSWLQNTSADVGIAVICGMGGIGKTTIAKDIYNSNFERFEGSSFLASIREISEQPNGLVHLQRQLLSDILKVKREHINNVDEGIVKIKDYIGCKRVLVILDGMDNRDIFDKTIGMRHWFHPGSKIILTTRNKHLFKPHEVCRIFEVEQLLDWESLILFSWHAFKQDHPVEGYVEQSKEVARHCGGLPLALEILGSSLSGKNLDIWECALQKLAAIPDSQIMEKLRISYDSLQDDHTRRLFLYIACFFFGEGKDFTIRILDGCKFHTTIGIDNLIDKCLLTINGCNKLMIHQLLRDMAREIVCQESPKEPGKRSLLWDNEHSLYVLTEKTGTEIVEALHLDMHLLNKSRGISNQIELKTEAFARMRNLRLLHLNDVKIKGGFKDFPKRLAWLSWHRFSLKSIPSDFPMESLVALDLSHSKLKHVWKGTKLMKSLKILNLSHCHGLTNTPNFTVCPNLEDLILEDCIHLVEVHESIGELKKLVSLSLQGCKNLKNLPREIHCLTSLVKLDISSCSKLNLSEEEEKMKSLTVHQANGMAISRTSTPFWVDSWSFLFKPFVLNPRKSPKSICCSLATLPASLVTLRLANCNLSNDNLLRSLGSLSLLQDLDLSKNPILSLPESIKFLTNLKSLSLYCCQRIQSLPELPLSLGLLDLTYCCSLEMVTNLPNLCTYLDLISLGCFSLVEAKHMFKLEPIGNIGLEIIENLGLADHLVSMGSYQVTFWNRLASKEMRSPIQGLSEFGIYSLFFPRSLVPNCCSNYKESGSIIEFNVPSDRNVRILALKVHVLCAYSCTWGGFDFIIITNKSKGLSWDYNPTWYCFPDEYQDWVWLSHWKIGHQYLMEGGDEMKVFACVSGTYKVKEVGVEIVWDKDEEEGSQNHNIYPSRDDGIDVVDLTPYLQGPGDYFLCHYYREPYQEYTKLQGQKQLK